MRRWFVVLLLIVCGCQAAATQQKKAAIVSNPHEAMVRANAYCTQQRLNWGEPVLAIPQAGGFYVEYSDAPEATDSPVRASSIRHHGLTVNADGTVTPAD